MKKILVPTDFSDTAEKALRVAADLARIYDSKIYVIHMLELPMDLINPVMGTRTNDMPEVLYFIKLAEKRLRELIQQDFMKDVTVQEILQLHRTFDGILDSSQREGCDLIVMGSQGASGLQEMFVGSNTEKVVRRSEIPVLVIKEGHPDFKVDTLVFGIDFTEEFQDVLTQVLDFTSALGARLHLVYINTGDTDNQYQLEKEAAEFLSGLQKSSYEFSIHKADSVETGVLEFADSVNADLVGMATHGRRGLAHFFNGSISEDLMNHTKQPVVTFRLT